MDEQEWLSSCDWTALWGRTWEAERVTDRVRRLIATAVCRRVAHLLSDPRSIRMMDLSEALADHGFDEDGWDEWEDACGEAWQAVLDVQDEPIAARSQAATVAAMLQTDDHKIGRALESAADVFGYLAAHTSGVLPSTAVLDSARSCWEHPTFVAGRDEEGGRIISEVIREIVGNPFRPVAFDPSWRTATAVGLARSMDESRDFAAMPILADALEDAGCDNPDVLAHYRDPNGAHVRGCWVVDLVLGKS